MTAKPDNLVESLRTVAAARGWTQAELGRLLGVGQPHVSKILSGDVPLSPSLKGRLRTLFEVAELGENVLEIRALSLMRRSPAFRRLIDAAIEMNENSLRG